MPLNPSYILPLQLTLLHSRIRGVWIVAPLLQIDMFLILILLCCWSLTSWQDLRWYPDRYSLVAVHTQGAFIVLSHWETTMTWHPTESHYPVTEPTSTFPILIMLSTWLQSNKWCTYKSLFCLDQGLNPQSTKTGNVCDQLTWPSRLIGELAEQASGHLYSHNRLYITYTTIKELLRWSSEDLGKIIESNWITIKKNTLEESRKQCKTAYHIFKIQALTQISSYIWRVQSSQNQQIHFSCLLQNRIQWCVFHEVSQLLHDSPIFGIVSKWQACH